MAASTKLTATDVARIFNRYGASARDMVEDASDLIAYYFDDRRLMLVLTVTQIYTLERMQRKVKFPLSRLQKHHSRRYSHHPRSVRQLT